MPSNNLSRDRCNKIPVSKLWGYSDLALFKMSNVRKTLSLSKVWVYRTLEEKRMSRVVISLKIFPSDVTIDLSLLKRKIEKGLPGYASVYRFVEEPIAFGLTALIVHIVIPEEKSGGLDEIEKGLHRIDEISEIETLMVRRV